MKNNSVFRIVLIALLSACCFIAFSLRISIPTPLGQTSFHLGNTICLLTALLFNGFSGGLVGSIGMGIGDLLDPKYAHLVPKTVINKTIMCLVTSFIAHKILKINNDNSVNKKKFVLLSIIIGGITNIVCELVVGYIYYKFILKADGLALSALYTTNLLSTSVNAVLTIIITYFLYFEIVKRFKDYIK